MKHKIPVLLIVFSVLIFLAGLCSLLYMSQGFASEDPARMLGRYLLAGVAGFLLLLPLWLIYGLTRLIKHLVDLHSKNQ